MSQMKLSVVTPVYKEEFTIRPFLQRLIPVLEKITPDYEIIFCLDPSPDRTWEVISEEASKNPKIKCLLFSRRFGQPMATLAGMQSSKGEAVVVIDVDLQDPPELIPEMIQKYREGSEVVYAQRRSRQGETWIKRVVSVIGYKVINHIAEVDIPPNTGDFRLMSRRVVDHVVHLKENHGFLRGMVSLVGFKQTFVMFDREARHTGPGNYNRLVGSLRIGFNGVFCFSNYALTLSTTAGFLIAFLAFVLAIFYLFLKIVGYPLPLGNPTIVILVLLLAGVQLISVGILGEYIGRIYDEVKQRPRFIINQTIGID